MKPGEISRIKFNFLFENQVKKKKISFYIFDLRKFPSNKITPFLDRAAPTLHKKTKIE